MGATRRFGADRSAVGDARRFVGAVLSEAGLDGLIDSALLLTSEIVSNAIMHGRSRPVVAVDTGAGRLRVEVMDASPVLPVRKHYRPDATTGRGLMLLDALASAWGSEAVEGGKRVWFELDERDVVEAAGSAEDASAIGAGGDVDLDALAASFGEVDLPGAEGGDLLARSSIAPRRRRTSSARDARCRGARRVVVGR